MNLMTDRITPTKVLLVSDPRSSQAARIDPSPPGIRRYRIVRVRFAGRELAANKRFDQLKPV
jgi:hypothetical protein